MGFFLIFHVYIYKQKGKGSNVNIRPDLVGKFLALKNCRGKC